MAELTEEEGRDARYGFELRVPGLNEPLQIEGSAFGASIRPHAYQEDTGKLHANIFMAFVPATGILRNLPAESGPCEGLPLVSSDPSRKRCLRTLNQGFLYLFHQKKLWREIKVSEKGDLTDIPVDLARSIAAEGDADPQSLNRRQPENQDSCERIWLPVRLNGKQCKGYRIAYSSVQWSWAYIQWLESEENSVALELRTQSLDDLYASYSQTGKGNGQFVRFGTESVLFSGIEDLGRMVTQRGCLLREAIGESDALCGSSAWENRKNEPDLNFLDSGAHLVGDANIHQDVDMYEEYANADQEILDQCRKESKAENKLLKQAGACGWGLFYVEDRLYEALFYSQRVHAYAASLEGMTGKIETPASAAVCWKVLDAVRMKPEGWNPSDIFVSPKWPERERPCTEEYVKAAKMLFVEDLWSDVLPGSRDALRKGILAMQAELAVLLGHGHAYAYVHPELPDLGIPGRMKKEVLTAERFRAAIRDYFTQEGLEYLNAWGIMQEIFSALSINAASLDPFFIYDPADKILLDPYQAGGNVIFGMLEERPRLGAGISYREMLFPKPVGDENPTTVLDSAKLDDQNEGNSQCRFNTLRNLLNWYLPPNYVQMEAQFAKVCGVGQIVFQLYANLILIRPDAAETALQHAVNLIRLAPGLEQMILASGDQVRDNRDLLIYTLETPGIDKLDPDRVRVAVDEKGNYHIYQYLGEYDFAVRKMSPNKLGVRTLFMAFLPVDRSNAGLELAGHISNIGATTGGLLIGEKMRGTSVSGLKGIRVPDMGFMNFLSAFISLHNLMVARNVISPDSPPAIVNLLQYANAITGASLGIYAARNLPSFFIGAGMKVLPPRWLSRLSFCLGGVLSAMEARKDFENEDLKAAGLNIAAAASFAAAFFISPWLAIPATVFMAFAWFCRSSDTEILLRASAYGIKRKRLPSQKDEMKIYDQDSVFGMYKKLFPVEKRASRQQKSFLPDEPSYEWHLGNLIRMCKAEKEKSPAVTDMDVMTTIDACGKDFYGKVSELHWPLFQPPAAREQVIMKSRDQRRGITLHMEGASCVARFYIHEVPQKFFLSYREEKGKFREFIDVFE